EQNLAKVMSPRRTWQAIAKWYDSKFSSFIKTMLGRSSAAQVRNDLELKSAALRDVGTDRGDLIEVGDGTVHGTIPSVPTEDDWEETKSNRFWGWRLDKFGETYFYGIEVFRSEDYKYRLGIRNNKLVFGSVNAGVELPYLEAISTGNLKQQSGSSTEYPMSQAATTAALNTKANTSHTHSADDITSGILPVSRGGTGVNSITNLKSAISLGYMHDKDAGTGGTQI